MITMYFWWTLNSNDEWLLLFPAAVGGIGDEKEKKVKEKEG